MERCAEKGIPRKGCLSFLGIGVFHCGSSKEVVGADTVEFCQCDNGINRIIQNAHFVLGIGVLTDSQILRNLFLRVSPVNSDTADILVFHNFIAHIITC